MRMPFNLGDSSHRDPEQSLVQIREKMLADSFPASDPPSSNLAPSMDSSALDRVEAFQELGWRGHSHRGVRDKMARSWFATRYPDRGSDQATMQGVSDSLEPIVGTQLLVDVMEMIAQCLWADSERLRDARSVVSGCEHS